jgi:hypothetical protein
MHTLNASRIARRVVAYAWASPNTVLGLFVGLVALAFGGRVRLVLGILEFSGGRAGRAVSAAPALFSFSAITFGHVVLGVSAEALEAARQHEHVHVAQYETWGPLFLPAYAASSFWQVLRRRHAYWDNFFEKRAYEEVRCTSTDPAIAVK